MQATEALRARADKVYIGGGQQCVGAPDWGMRVQQDAKFILHASDLPF